MGTYVCYYSVLSVTSDKCQVCLISSLYYSPQHHTSLLLPIHLHFLPPTLFLSSLLTFFPLPSSHNPSSSLTHPLRLPHSHLHSHTLSLSITLTLTITASPSPSLLHRHPMPSAIHLRWVHERHPSDHPPSSPRIHGLLGRRPEQHYHLGRGRWLGRRSINQGQQQGTVHKLFKVKQKCDAPLWILHLSKLLLVYFMWYSMLLKLNTSGFKSISYVRHIYDMI